MFKKFTNNLKNLHIGQKGMTGLETAIILIAFVTVASVLAYSVLSAGIFSAEKGKATVYSGLEQAQATMAVHGSVVATSSDNSTTDYVEFLVGLTIPGETVDMAALVLNNYSGSNQTNLSNESWNSTALSAGKWQYVLAPGATERGTASTLEGDELMLVKADLSAFDTISAYDWFTTEILPPKGAAITIKRVMPGQLTPKMDLK